MPRRSAARNPIGCCWHDSRAGLIRSKDIRPRARHVAAFQCLKLTKQHLHQPHSSLFPKYWQLKLAMGSCFRFNGIGSPDKRMLTAIRISAIIGFDARFSYSMKQRFSRLSDDVCGSRRGSCFSGVMMRTDHAIYYMPHAALQQLNQGYDCIFKQATAKWHLHRLCERRARDLLH